MRSRLVSLRRAPATLQFQVLGRVLELLEDRRPPRRRRRDGRCAQRGPGARRWRAARRGRIGTPAAPDARCLASTSSRSRRNTGARSEPPGVHSLKVTSATSSGFEPGRRAVQRRGFSANGEVLRSSFAARPSSGGDALILEARADVSGVAQRLALVVAEQQGTERLARALAARVAADHELRGLGRFDLEPGARALTAAGRRCRMRLAMMPSKPRSSAAPYSSSRVIGGVDQLQVRCRQQALRQVAAPVAVGRAAQIQAGEVQQVKAHQHHRGFALRGGDLGGRLQLRAVLQRVERGSSRGIQRHDLAIEDHAAGGLRREIRGELGKERR